MGSKSRSRLAVTQVGAIAREFRKNKEKRVDKRPTASKNVKDSRVVKVGR